MIANGKTSGSACALLLTTLIFFYDLLIGLTRSSVIKNNIDYREHRQKEEEEHYPTGFRLSLSLQGTVLADDWAGGWHDRDGNRSSSGD